MTGPRPPDAEVTNAFEGQARHPKGSQQNRWDIVAVCNDDGGECMDLEQLGRLLEKCPRHICSAP
jgi:hypothetical protein